VVEEVSMRYALVVVGALAVVAAGWTGATLAGPGDEWVFDPDPEIDSILQEVERVEAKEERMKLAFELRMTPRAVRLARAQASLTSAQLKLDACREQLEKVRVEREGE
jgi:phage terminase Nu1 subunit (DNA packaging protein)